MPPNDKLPAELAALEASLAALQPASSRLNRDQVMYAAGLTVALQESALNPQLALGARGFSPRSDSLTRAPSASWGSARQTVLYSLASAATAACLAVLITRAVLNQQAPVANKTDQQVVVSSGEVQQPRELPVDRQFEPPARAGGWGFDFLLAAISPQQPPSQPAGFRRGASLLTLQNPALYDQILNRERTLRPRPETFTNATYAPPMTAHQLRAELLPELEQTLATPAPTKAWHWLKFWNQPGETI